MAIAYRVGQTGSSSISTSSTTITLSGSAQSGDLAVVLIASRLGNDSVSSAPADWTALVTSSGIRTTNLTFFAYYKILAGGEPGSDITFNYGGGNAGRAYGVGYYSGVHQTTPVIQTGSTNTATSVVTINALGVTTDTTANCWGLAVYSFQRASGTNAWSSFTWTNRSDASTMVTDTFRFGAALADSNGTLATSSATGNKSATVTNVAQTGNMTAVLFIIQPAVDVARSSTYRALLGVGY